MDNQCAGFSGEQRSEERLWGIDIQIKAFSHGGSEIAEDWRIEDKSCHEASGNVAKDFTKAIKTTESHTILNNDRVSKTGAHIWWNKNQRTVLGAEAEAEDAGDRS
jgi:hypothetical protein